MENNNHEYLKTDLAEIKETMKTMSTLDQKLDSKITMLENKINSTNKWIISLSIIAIVCVTSLAFVVILKK